MLFVGQKRVWLSNFISFRVLPLSRFSESVQNIRIVKLKAIKSPQVLPILDAMQTYLDLQHSSIVIENLK